MYYNVIIYDWPESQLCSDCINGELVESVMFNSACYICNKDYLKNNGIECNEQLRTEEKES